MIVPVFFPFRSVCTSFLGKDLSLSLSPKMWQLNIDGLELAEEEPQMLGVLRRGQMCPQTRSTERVGKY